MEEPRKRAASEEVAFSDKRIKLSGKSNWLFQEPAFQSWSDGSAASSFLWVHGPPGCGKTVITQKVVRRLKDEDRERRTVTHFCNAHSTPGSIARSIWGQLHGTERAQQQTTTSQSSIVDEGGFKLWDEIKSSITSSSPITLVIDGLDEIECRFTEGLEHDFAQVLTGLATSEGAHAKVFVTCRPQSPLYKAFDGQPDIEITPNKTREDLESFIEDQLVALPNGNTSTESVVSAMISKSNGIFITAQIIIYILASTEGTWSVEDIETLPQDIKSLYSIAYERSSAKLQPFELLLRRHCLRWLAIGIQPIRVEEALNALNVESNALPSNFNDQVMRACGPLITIENDVLKPVHPTLKEYLLGPGIGTMLGSAERIQVTHSEVAKTCLRYLLHQAFGANSMDTTDLHALRATYPLLQYSSMYWIQHVTLADPSDSELFELVKALFLTRNGFLWADVLLPAFMPTSVLPLPPRATHNARIFHLFMLKNQLVRFFKSAHPEIDDHLSNFLRNSYEEALATAREDPTKGLKVMKRLMDLSVLYSWLPDQRPKASQLIHEAYHVLIYESSAPREIAIQLLQALGDDHKINGRYEKAGTAYLQLLDTYQSSPPDTDPQLIFVYDALGWVQMRLGQLDKAEKSLRSALEMAVEFYGARSPFTLRSKVTLAEVLSKLGQAEEAESLCTQLTEQLEQHHLNGVPLPKDSISQLNTLALIYKARGDHLRTKEAFAVVVEDRRKIFGGEHPMTLWATAQMALAQRAAGELDAAREVFAILLPLQEKILGSEHPDVKESKNQLEEIGPHDG